MLNVEAELTWINNAPLWRGFRIFAPRRRTADDGQDQRHTGQQHSDELALCVPAGTGLYNNRQHSADIAGIMRLFHVTARVNPFLPDMSLMTWYEDQSTGVTKQRQQN